MSPPQPNQEKTCPDCGATLREKGSSCWLCHVAVEEVVPAAAEPPASIEGRARAPIAAGDKPVVIFERRAAYQFSLASLMLIVTLFAVLLGVFRMALGLGIVLAILVTPALVRTCMIAARSRAGGRPMSVGRKVSFFAGTLGLLAIMAVAVSAAFVATCFPLGFLAAANALGPGGKVNPGLFVLAWVLGVAVGLGVLYVLFRLFRRLWPRGN